MTADPDLIEGERGFYDLFCSGGRGYNHEKVVESFGNPFCVTQIFTKKYGCCFFSHRAMDALVGLLDEHKIRFEDVANVGVDIPPFVAHMLRYAEPANGEEAKFSLEQALGSILADGKLELPHTRPFSDAGAADPQYQAARRMVKVTERKDWAGGRSVPWSTPVTVNLKDGRSFTRAVGADEIKGGGKNPLSRDELTGRYRAMVQGFLSPAQIDRSIELVLDLENLDSVAELTALATFGNSK